MATIDKASVRESYEDVRNDNSETIWAFYGFDESNKIRTIATGAEFEELLQLFKPDERSFAFLRVITGDELSKRAKFALLTWCGDSVSPLKRARTAADKTLVKDIVQSYAVDMMFSDISEITEERIKEEVKKVGGANYGRGE